MRYLTTAIILFSLVIPAVAEEDASKPVDLSVVLKHGEASRYDLKVVATGKALMPGGTQPVPMDAALDIAVRVRTGEPQSDGSTELTVTSESAMATIAEQKITMSTDMFPKITALLDKSGCITRMFASDPLGDRLPGINYRNFLLLFNPYAPEGEVGIGANWKKTIQLPPDREKYEISSTLVGLEEIDGSQTAKVRSEIVVVPPEGANYTAGGTAVSNFSLDGARLIKSHVEMSVKMKNPAVNTPDGSPATDAPGETEALVKLDVSRRQVTGNR